MPGEVDNIVRSPYDERKYELPNEPLIPYCFKQVREGLKNWPKDKPWIVEVVSNRKILLKDVESNAYKIASALTRMGFKKGDFTYFSSYEMAQIFQIQVAMQLIGGALRGNHPNDEKANYVAQIQQIRPKFVMVDQFTIDRLKEALKEYDGEVQMISVGDEKVPGTVHYDDLLKDDGSAYPENVDIDPENDIVAVLNTSGSTGRPKGVAHSHRSFLAAVITMDTMCIRESMFGFMANFGIVANGMVMHNLCHGVTTYHYRNVDKEKFMDNLLTIKPRTIVVYPYLATWLSKQADTLAKMRELDFLRVMLVGGWVLDVPSADALSEGLPNAHIKSMYGMTEMLCVSITDGQVGVDTPAKVRRSEREGKTVASSGRMVPHASAKVIDLTTRKPVGPMEQGEIMIKSATLMKGYCVAAGEPLDTSGFDEDGYFSTGDLGYFDKDMNMYVLERMSFIYKHMCYWLSPTDIETVLLQHPDVLQVGVVNVPCMQFENVNKAYVVKRQNSDCTEQDLVQYVEDRTVFYKHLHRGVSFMETLPTGLTGKVDRNVLKRMASQETQ